jgi:hypothetical protein
MPSAEIFLLRLAAVDVTVLLLGIAAGEALLTIPSAAEFVCNGLRLCKVENYCFLRVQVYFGRRWCLWLLGDTFLLLVRSLKLR